ncbi:MAG TPA: PQQ-binding-like beta-propeller repeat protein [Spirochaetota bacterium]|nr:PQQ-binding-like beta-propeller repeat protein [Spirochaetota bacterium]
MSFLSTYRFRKWHVAPAFVLILIIYFIFTSIPFGTYAYTPVPGEKHAVPLDPESPWPKFRADALQSGRGRVVPVTDPSLRPWMYKTGKGIFSSPVIDAEGTAYIGSADHWFYALGADGSLKWKFKTGEIIDSSALLDDRGRVYVGSGDAHVYCLERSDGRPVWKMKAHTVREVEKEFGLKTYNLDWFEGNIGMLADGTLIAPNDNYLVYAIDRDTGARKTQYVGNELMWSLPAVNAKTGRIFFGSQYMALENVYCYDTATGKKRWANGGLGSNAASPVLTSDAHNGAVVLGGFDGYVRAYAQDSGKQLWKRGLRDHIYASPAQLSDGAIIQPSADGTVYALEPSTGDIRWSFDTLEPIRSSPAVDAHDRIYVGSGEGRLFCINPDGTLRWAYRCIDEDRNDLNGSPGLGRTGVYIGGENGGVFFVPYDYPLSPAGMRDARCARGPGEDLPAEGSHLVFTTHFGKLRTETPERIDANQPLAYTLLVRDKGDTLKSAIDRDSVVVEVSGSPPMRVDVSANRQFLVVTPRETWTAPAGGELTVGIKGSYLTGLRRFGLKFFGGSGGGKFEYRHVFHVAPRGTAGSPYRVPKRPGDASTVFELSRLAAPNPTMLPSWNQIGFDSLHYLCGVVEGDGKRMLVWTVGGKLHNGKTLVNPALEARFPLVLEYDGGLLTFRNYDGFKINFVGSWDMPFGSYRVSSKADPATGALRDTGAFSAIALCDEIEYYGRFLKLMGMSEFDTGHMAVFGGMNLGLHGRGYAAMPAGVGMVAFGVNGNTVQADIKGGTLKKDEHVFSLMLVDDATGNPLALYYTKHTTVESDDRGVVRKIGVRFPGGSVKGKLRVYYMVDTYPAARGVVNL